MAGRANTRQWGGGKQFSGRQKWPGLDNFGDKSPANDNDRRVYSVALRQFCVGQDNQPSNAKVGTPQVTIVGAVVRLYPGSLFNIDDSSIGAVAMHAGLLHDGKTGRAVIEIMPVRAERR